MKKYNHMETGTANRVTIPPPFDLTAYGPSALMRYFIAAGDWSYDAFADDVSKWHKTKVMNTDTVVGWANHDVLPKPYRAALLRLIDDQVDPEQEKAWRQAFQIVWAQHFARSKIRPANLNVASSGPGLRPLGKA